MKKLLPALLILISFHLSAQQNAEPVKVTDLLQIKTITGLTISPDGKQLVYSLNSIEPEGESKLDYKYVNQLWLLNTDGSTEPRQITGKDGGSQPVFSPDGKQLAFTRSADGKAQIFLLDLLNGGEARQLTRFRYGASAPKFSPDGQFILFSAGVSLKDLLKDSVLNPDKKIPAWSYEKPGVSNTDVFNHHNAKANPDGNIDEVRTYLDQNATDNKARVITKLNFQDEMDISTDMSFNHLFITGLKPGSQPLALTHGFYRFGAASFTPDGKQLVIAGDIDSLEHPDRSQESELFIVNTDGSDFHLLLGEKGKQFNSPSVSPSGKWLSFSTGSPNSVSIPDLAVMPLNGTMKDISILPFDRNKSGISWSSDEKSIYFNALSNGGAPLYKTEIATKKTVMLTAGYDEGINAFQISGDKVYYTRTAVSSPSELWVSSITGANAKQLTHLNDDWISKRKISVPEKHSFVNEKGMTVEYWVMKPVDYTPGKKYPLLLEIHGGPSAMWGPGEASMWHEYQYFCGKGYGIVYSNPRGSGGYGLNFLRGNIKDWGTGPARDVLTALDKTVAEGWADTSKLIITGGSYAGYLTAWIIAHDHRFKAACAQRGVYDLSTFFGEGNAWRLVPNYFGGYPWEPAVKATLDSQSPIHYVNQITTPFIIFHGDNDRRTGFVQGEMMYRSLKVLGRPVEYVRHPGATHEITRSGNNRQRIDQLLRTWEFFQRWAGQ